MYRSALFADFARLVRMVREVAREEERPARPLDPPRIHRIGRREWLAQAGRTAAVTAAAAIVPPTAAAALPRRRQNISIGIVGAGLAGLACADALKAGGLRAAVYDAADRTGGRCFSLRGVFPGQVAERGGEFIDNLHKTMLGYARRFDLTLEDVNKEPGDVFYFFDGERRPEAVIVDQLREFIAVMRADLRRLSREVTAAAHTPADVELDRTSLLEYLEGRNAAGVAAGPVIREAIVQAYVAEYGLAAAEQSCLNFLLFIHADRRSKFTPFSNFSDERYHVIDGNERIAEGLTSGVAGQIELGMSLVRVRRTPAGLIELTLQRGGQTLVRSHDVAVLTIPFTVLQHVELDGSLGLPLDKQRAIFELGYGTNAKMMVGFSARPWAALGSNGSSYADLPNHQTVWETNPVRATSHRAILTDYSGAERGAHLDALHPQIEAARFLSDLDKVFPGAAAAATRIEGQFRVHLEHWPSNPLTRGSYTCYRPGQFTTIAGIEGQPVGNLYFAGEHANSFYEWQGFMEGAAISGIDAAEAILKVAKRSRAMP